jgi:hypothetical protein
MQKKRGRKEKSAINSHIQKQLSLHDDDLQRLDLIVAYRAASNKSGDVVMRSGVVRELIFSALEEIKY